MDSAKHEFGWRTFHLPNRHDTVAAVTTAIGEVEILVGHSLLDDVNDHHGIMARPNDGHHDLVLQARLVGVGIVDTVGTEAMSHNPYDPVEMVLSDWRRRGGPGRLDRAAASKPRRFAVIFAVTFTLGIGAPMTFVALLLGSWWGWAMTVAVLTVGGTGMFLAVHRNFQKTADAFREWEDREQNRSDGS